jgi:hypothetical protein
VLSERAKLPHGDPVALDRVFLGEVGSHVIDEGAGDGRAGNTDADALAKGGDNFNLLFAGKVIRPLPLAVSPRPATSLDPRPGSQDIGICDRLFWREGISSACCTCGKLAAEGFLA